MIGELMKVTLGELPSIDEGVVLIGGSFGEKHAEDLLGCLWSRYSAEM